MVAMRCGCGTLYLGSRRLHTTTVYRSCGLGGGRGYSAGHGDGVRSRSRIDCSGHARSAVRTVAAAHLPVSPPEAEPASGAVTERPVNPITQESGTRAGINGFDNEKAPFSALSRVVQ